MMIAIATNEARDEDIPDRGVILSVLSDVIVPEHEKDLAPRGARERRDTLQTG